jgi:hypothetical protein
VQKKACRLNGRQMFLEQLADAKRSTLAKWHLAEPQLQDRDGALSYSLLTLHLVPNLLESVDHPVHSGFGQPFAVDIKFDQQPFGIVQDVQHNLAVPT